MISRQDVRPAPQVREWFAWERSQPDRLARPTNAFEPIDESEIEGSILKRFRKIVQRYPDRLALKGSDAEFTYDALNRTANRVAWAVLGASKVDVPSVAILFEHGALGVATLMGVLKAGKAYVPLDASYPHARLAYMLDDSQADLILTNGTNLALATDLASDTYRVIDVEALDPGLSDQDPVLDVLPENLAYILYTSGTTGQPKGVPGTHKQVLHFAHVHTNACHIGPGDRVSQVNSLCFSASLICIFASFISGATLVTFDLKNRGIGHLKQWLREVKITYLGCVPSVLRHLCATLEEGETFPDVRLVTTGGDRVETKDFDLYKKHFRPGTVLRVGLGTTEVKLITEWFLNHDTQIAGNTMPVGYPPPGIEIFLLDESGLQVAPGEVGEIAVRTRYMTPGYWRRPDLTAAKFLPDLEGSDARIYLTGDLGRMGPDGLLTHVGRKDFQIKIRGYRVETAEVEGALLGLEEVQEAAVVARADVNGNQQLVAYVVPSHKPELDVWRLRHALVERLPDYMVPSGFVLLDEMPLNENRKVDRRNLPAPDPSTFASKADYMAPRDALEQRLAELWQEYLGVDQVGVRDDFFELGGNSLQAATMWARIEKLVDRQLPLVTLLQAPTVEQLAALLRDESWAPQWDSLVPIQTGGSKPPLFCPHGTGGHVLHYVALARHVGTDQPVYGLQAQGLDGKGPIQTSIEEMAAHYVEAVRSFWPQGPYCLAGYCMGGTIAFEMAQQLVAQGQEVAALVLFDTWNWSQAGRVAREEVEIRSFARTVLDQWHNMRMIDSWAGRRAFVGELVEVVKRRLRRRATVRKLSFPLVELERAISRAGRDYAPHAYPGRILHFRVENLSPDFSDLRAGWDSLATDGVEAHIISCYHGGMLLEPFVRQVAMELGTCLDQAYRRNDLG